MTLFTKSIQEKPTPKDGIRICIMRRPNSDAIYDVLMPVLAPSHELLTDIHTKKIDKPEYNRRFHNEVVLGQKKFIKFLANIAMTNDVTILCWEETPDKCHRKLVAEACKKVQPELRVVLK
jgi:uncharacterized protein YeaO (DUF488 family)